MPLSRLPEPEPLDWRTKPGFRERLVRAASTPALVGGVVFAAAVIIAVVIVLAQPHTADGLAEPQSPPLGETGVEVGDDADPSGTESAAKIVAHVVGEVGSPGVVELEAGARVLDAIEAAGGATPDAVLEGINLARTVADGEQISVPDSEGAALSPGPAVATPGSIAPNPSDLDSIDINSADAAMLETLPRVGPALARRIIDWRQANGGFSSVDQLLEVSGIGERTLEGLRDRVRV